MYLHALKLSQGPFAYGVSLKIDKTDTHFPIVRKK